jgi:hypothetical protein
MKRNKLIARALRRGKKTKEGGSKYAVKLRRNKMMYGPGCCGHDKVRKT